MLMFKPSPYVMESKLIVTNKLMNYCKILYGLTPENLPTELFKVVIKNICDNLISQSLHVTKRYRLILIMYLVQKRKYCLAMNHI